MKSQVVPSVTVTIFVCSFRQSDRREVGQNPLALRPVFTLSCTASCLAVLLPIYDTHNSQLTAFHT